MDIYGMLQKGAVFMSSSAAGYLTKMMGGDEETAKSMSSIVDQVSKVAGLGSIEEQ